MSRATSPAPSARAQQRQEQRQREHEPHRRHEVRIEAAQVALDQPEGERPEQGRREQGAHGLAAISQVRPACKPSPRAQLHAAAAAGAWQHDA
ncbi:hypothetical protein OV079_41595 [Nannocystis pusilla]|uniref:Uncharacterized protein n=1 Tax=Nannocystis pusilla TaxID=889268 RepID=A0A9X3F5L3_9BACT|nr:hypothetical protein [Nannocystis pusilla]MCY1011931.1 hypothetical protein [Nannocystis pusilla]